MKKPVLVLGILILTILVLFGVRAAVSNRISTSGVVLGDVQEQIAEYKTQNAIIKEKILAESSLTHVSSLASKKGFVESKTTFAVSGGTSLARR